MKPNSEGKTQKLKFFRSLDRVAIITILVLSLLIIILLRSGASTAVQVSNFSWEGEQVGVEDRAFFLTFNRPVEHAKVEENLRIRPSLSGKISWAGRRMAYTLTELPVYGTTYQVQLEGAKERYDSEKALIEPFTTQFQTRDRIFAYLGVEEGERGQLFLYNLTQQRKDTLTPADLVVRDFRVYPNGDRILFSAFDATSQGQGLNEPQLYTVTTGLNFQSPENPQPAGRIDRVLDPQDYQNLQFQNLQFDLSADGKTLVVERVNRRDPNDFGLWVVPEDGNPRPLGTQGDEFMIAPDGQVVAVTQRRGVAIIPLTPEAGSSEFFLGYGAILAFSQDGSAKVMVKYNQDYTRSLFLVTSEGTEKELLITNGSIISCEFEPEQEKTLYCLLTELFEDEGQYQEEPFLAAIDLDTSQVVPLIALPSHPDVQISMSPDGLALLFDQIATTDLSSTSDLITEDGQAIIEGLLWRLPLPDIPSEEQPTRRTPPEELFPGFQPRWFP